MNKHVLLCAAFLSALSGLLQADEEKRGKDLAADMLKRSVEAAADEQAEVRSSCCSCSSTCKTCSKCSKCSKCCKCCKSMITKSEVSEEQAVTKACAKCGCSCGKCGCKSVEMDQAAESQETKCACNKPKPKSEDMGCCDQAEEDAA